MNTVFVDIGWNTSAIILSIVLGFSFRRIRQLSKKLETTGIFCNERLMFVHYGAFVSATILGSLATACTIAMNAHSGDKALRL